MATKPSVTGRAKGGFGAAKKLSPRDRTLRAKRAAAMRWGASELPQAVCSSEDTPLRIAGVELDAYVLPDGTRVLSQGGFLRALGRNRKAAARSTEVPPMLQGASLAAFLTPEILEKAQPIAFRTPNGLRASGYRAELLPDVCEVYLKARDAATLAPNQRPVAVQADILMRGLATVGIIALVDEATGYQELRAKNSLAHILELFIAKELQAWVKTFPNDFYRQIFRLRGLDYPEGTVKRPQYFGQLTNDIVYRRLAPAVLDELKKVRNDDGKPNDKLFQRLSTNVGYPKLREHLGSVVTLMKLSQGWPDFKHKLDTIHPKYGTTLPLPFEEDELWDF